MKIKTITHYYSEINQPETYQMSNAVILTKIKNLSILMTQPWYGTILNNVALPLCEGHVVLRNMSNIDIEYNGEKFAIKVDDLINKDLLVGKTKEEKLEECRKALFVTTQQLNELLLRFGAAGAELYKQLTGSESLDEALAISNSFLKEGVNVIAKKKENGMNYSFPVNGKLHTTTNSNELLIFLGSLANVYLQNKQQPDPRWFSENKPDDFVY